MSRDSSRLLRERNQEYIQLGLIVIGLRGLTRKRIGGKCLLVLYDDTLQDPDKAIIGSIEADMNNNLGICYICPDYSLKIKDFVDNIKILVQAKGYGSDLKGSNIQLDLIFMGKTTNNMNVNYKVRFNEIVQSLQTNGLNFLKPLNIDSKSLAGTEWTIELRNKEETLKPTQATTFKPDDNRLGIRFTHYEPCRQNEDDRKDSIIHELEQRRDNHV